MSKRLKEEKRRSSKNIHAKPFIPLYLEVLHKIDPESSFISATYAIKAILESVETVLLKEEIKKQSKPYSVAMTQSILLEEVMTAFQMYDRKLDDKYFQNEDNSEPFSLINDNFLPNYCNVSQRENLCADASSLADLQN
jgi:hypothetical protein